MLLHAGKLRSLIPYQPVYSREMTEKIAMVGSANQIWLAKYAIVAALVNARDNRGWGGGGGGG